MTTFTDKQKYDGTLSDYTVKTTKTGQPIIELWFEVTGVGTVKHSAFMTPKTIERTFKTLALLGLTGDINAIADGPTSGALKIGTVAKIQIEIQKDESGTTKTDKKGNPYFQVSFVNAATKPKHDPTNATEGKKKLTQFAGEWMNYQKTNGIKKEDKKTSFDPGL